MLVLIDFIFSCIHYVSCFMLRSKGVIIFHFLLATEILANLFVIYINLFCTLFIFVCFMILSF